MATLTQVIDRLTSLRDGLPLLVEKAAEETKDSYVDMNRAQLFDGKTRTGEDIRPSYFEDPYFQTPQAAQRYSDWKDRVTPSLRRTKGTPNLYINGYYYSSLGAKVSSNGVEITTNNFGNEITQKYGPNLYGLNKEGMDDYKSLYFNPVFRNKVVEIVKVPFV